jgi:hypothetical protein
MKYKKCSLFGQESSTQNYMLQALPLDVAIS